MATPAGIGFAFYPGVGRCCAWFVLFRDEDDDGLPVIATSSGREL